MSRPAAPTDPAPRFVELAGGPAAYTEEGRGPPIVAIHGLPGSTRDFRWLGPALAPHFRFIRVDLPGFGATPWRTHPAYAPEDRAAFVLDLVDALGLERPALLGHSMGGVVGTAALARRPDGFSALVLVASPGLVVHRALRRFPGRTLSGWFAHPTRSKLTMPALRRTFRVAGFRGRYPDEALLHTVHGAAAVDMAAHARRLRALRAPTAVVWCDDDPLIEPEIPAALDALLPAGPRLHFADGGHNPQKHHALELAAALAAWPALRL